MKVMAFTAALFGLFAWMLMEDPIFGAFCAMLLFGILWVLRKWITAIA